MKAGRGFTLIELLVVLGVVAALVAISLPVLGSSREASRQLRCLAHIRSAGHRLALYSNDHREALPFGPWARETREIEPIGTITWGGGMMYIGGRWSYHFPEEWAGGRWSRGMQCPEQSRRHDPMSPNWWENQSTPMYEMSRAVWEDQRNLAQDSGPDFSFPLTPHRLGDVAFPSLKGYLAEFPMLCTTDPKARFWQELGQTQGFPSSVQFFDGSAQRLRLSDGIQAPIMSPVLVTVGGIRGRDFHSR
ncbi:MAG: prepilin-type N-terminal cleavage/methylation domain-containing protein [Phycisphaeraceae bacterium]|nr:MAG: prepilin-type N-terminal cleavage/methylation domain-containing protein [Phycisphaeraceae bacterium]